MAIPATARSLQPSPSMERGRRSKAAPGPIAASISQRAVLVGAALLACSPAIADPIAPTALVPALDVYVDSVVAGHLAAPVCAPAKSPARDEAAWAKAKAIFVATLWANDFPIDFVRTVGQRLDAKAAGSKPDCTNPALKGELGDAENGGWVDALETPLKGMDLKLVVAPLPADAWNQMKVMIGKAAASQTRLFDCVAVSEPGLLPAAVHDWDQMIIGLGASLMAAGVPRDELSATLSVVRADTLWHRAAPDTEAELRDSCAKDPSWQNRFSSMAFLGLKGDLEKMLPQQGESSK